MNNSQEPNKRIFVSDIHVNAGLGFNNSKKGKAKKHPYEWLSPREAQSFADFLADVYKQDDVAELILLGDLVDDWVYPVDIEPPTIDDILSATVNDSIIKALNKLSKKKKVLYLPGNHDMGMTEEVLHKHLPDVDFGGSALQNSIFRAGRLRAEHGSAHAMFNAPVPTSLDSDCLPLGYYISRLVATRERETGEKTRHYWAYAIDQLFQHGPQPLALNVFRVVLNAAGLSENTKIEMPKKAGKKKRTVTASEIGDRYADIYDQWSNWDKEVSAWRAVSAEVEQLGLVADSLCGNNGTNIVIFGHSHGHDLYKSFRIYANCGSWCEEGEPHTFVQTQKIDDTKTHMVQLFKWTGKKCEFMREEEIHK